MCAKCDKGWAKVGNSRFILGILEFLAKISTFILGILVFSSRNFRFFALEILVFSLGNFRFCLWNFSFSSRNSKIP